MKTLWTIIGVIVLIAIVYFVYQNMNKNKISTVAVNTPVTPVPGIRRDVVISNQVYNPYPQEYLNSFGPNPELIRMNNAILQSKTYVFTCTRKNKDGTTTTTSGYSSSPSGNCTLGFEEKIIKTVN